MSDTTAQRYKAPRYKAPPDRELVPRMMVRAMLVLVVSVLALVSYARYTDMPLIATPPDSPVVLERMVVIQAEMSGAAAILDQNGALVGNLSPEEGGFISGVGRVLERERTKHGVPLDDPVTITGHADGRISVHDPSTGWGADLMGFGQDNAKAFVRLLTSGAKGSN